MPRPSTPGLLACVLAALAIGPYAAIAADAIEQAHAAIRKRDAQAAIRLLEPELARPGADRSRVVPLLIQGYDLAIAQATAAGKTADAEFYRENLKILSRKNRSRAATTPPPAPAPSAATQAPAPAPVAPLPAPEPIPVEPPKPLAPEPQPIAPLPDSPRPEPPRPIAQPEPVQPPPTTPPPAPGALNLPPAPDNDPPPQTPPPTPAPRPSATPVSDSPNMPGSLGPKQGPEPQPDLLAQADALYLSKRYDEARAIYAKLAAAGQLPQERRDHWAYCRSVAVAKKIQAKPKADAEWAAIDQEIEAIRRLNPKMWYAEYLRNRAAERGRGLASKAPARGGKAALRDPMVVRSAGPEEPAAAEPEPMKPVPRPEPAPRPQPVARQPEPAPAMVAAAPAPAAPLDPRAIPWQFKETGSFRIHHTDAALAESIANIAEKTRSDQTKRWTGSAPAMAWWPKCEIIVYPDGKTFAAATQQPEDSPGFSTIGMDQGRITARLVHIRADHAGTLEAVLPHEVTHIILADLFPNQQIPRWADEGMAVMSEPGDEQDKRATDLNEPLKAGRLFPLRTLMAMDYPDNRFWNLYYAQSVSLTRFLVEQGSPAQLVQFLHLSQKSGVEEGLRQVYKISGFEDLEKRWNAYAKSNLTQRVAVAPK